MALCRKLRLSPFDDCPSSTYVRVSLADVMSYNKVNYEETETKYGMHFLRDELGCEDHGVTVVDADPGWEGPEHEHGDENHEEVYLLIEGNATVSIEGEDVSLEAGDAVRIPPEATRQITNGDTESQFVLTGAPE